MKALVLLPLLLAPVLLAQTKAPADPHAHDLGYSDTQMLPGEPWRVHDVTRPHPALVTPGATPSFTAPSDAVVLFDGHDLAQWQSVHSAQTKAGADGGPPEWRLGEDFMEVVPGKGAIQTRAAFGDVQLHVEWSSPNPPVSAAQGRGNSGIIFMGLYEVQVLDAWQNPTYADGQAGAVYGQAPPLANPARKPGEWNVYDIVFEAPRMEGARVLKPAYVTVFFNGVLVQNHREILGATEHVKLPHYDPQPAQAPLLLQNHSNPVRYRNIWARKLTLE